MYGKNYSIYWLGIELIIPLGLFYLFSCFHGDRGHERDLFIRMWRGKMNAFSKFLLSG